MKEQECKFGNIAIWLYFFFLIFEGAFRKWFLPSFSNIFLVIKDPLALFVVIIACKYGLHKNIFIRFCWFIAFITIVTTLLWGHQNLFVALYGARVWIYFIPFIFAVPFFFTTTDVLKMCKYTLYITIGMTILLYLQYFTPQTSIFNIGVGGVGSSGFAGVGDFFRPSGTFSFTDGLTGFLLLSGCSFWICYLMADQDKKGVFKVNRIILWFSLICLFISIPITLSRSVITQTVILFVWVTVILITHPQKNKVVFSLLIMMMFIPLLTLNEQVRLAIGNMQKRFEIAAKAEGDFVSGSIVNRNLKYVFAEVMNNEDVPFFHGKGIGISTNVAATIFTGKKDFLTREGGSDLIENGYLIGSLMFFFKWILLIYILIMCYRARKYSPIPLIFALFCIIIRPGIGQTPNIVGFSTFGAAITLTLALRARTGIINEQIIDE
jgi:hypothetical protein